MAETISKEQWDQLARMDEARLRTIVVAQLGLADRAAKASPLVSKPTAQLLQQAHNEQEQADQAAAGQKRGKYNAAYSKARWVLDDLAAPLTAAGKGALVEELTTEALALLGGPQAPPAPPPMAPPPAKPWAPPTTKTGKTRQEELAKLLKLGPAELRRRAVQQRDAIRAKLEANRGFFSNVLSQWKQYDQDVVEIGHAIEQGDELQRGDPADQQKATARYAYALREGQRVARTLDQKVAEGGTAVLFFREVLDVTEEGARETGRVIAENAKDVKDLAGKAARGAGDTLRTGTLMIAGGLALGLAVAAASRLGGSSKRRGRDFY